MINANTIAASDGKSSATRMAMLCINVTVRSWPLALKLMKGNAKHHGLRMRTMRRQQIIAARTVRFLADIEGRHGDQQVALVTCHL
jgi:hypothetical protein